MPTRQIKESIWDSPTINSLSVEAERHFYRLLPLPDDNGCFQASADVVKGRLYPKQPNVTECDIMGWYLELETDGMCRFWVQDGRLYGIFVNWSKHQRIRALHQRKTPPPPDNILELTHTIRDMVNNGQVAVKCRQVPSVGSGIPIPNPILNPIPNPKEEKTSDVPSVNVDNSVENSKEQVEAFLAGKTGFGKGGNDRSREFRDEVKRVCLAFIERCRKWGDDIPDEKAAVNEIFGMVLNLMSLGVPKKPKNILNFRGNPTDMGVALELVAALSRERPKDPVAELIDAFKRPPVYRRY